MIAHDAMPVLAGLLTGRVAADEARAAFAPGELARHARDHGVAGLLYRRLRSAGGLAALAPADAEALERRHAGQVARSALQWPEIGRVLSALHGAGIPYRLLKGAALALTVYEEPSDRPMDDLDLLIPEDRIDEAVRVIGTLGYVPEDRPENRPGLNRKVFYEVSFDGPAPARLHVEFHWSLIGGRYSRYRPDMAWFWGEEGTKGPGGVNSQHPTGILNVPSLHSSVRGCSPVSGSVRSVHSSERSASGREILPARRSSHLRPQGRPLGRTECAEEVGPKGQGTKGPRDGGAGMPGSAISAFSFQLFRLPCTGTPS